MDKWYVFVVVGLVVGMNLGYMVGIRRGMLVIADLVAGVAKGFSERSKE